MQTCEMKDYTWITSNVCIILIQVNLMDIQDGGISQVSILLQKSLRYKHRKENYIQPLEEKVKA